MSVQQLADRKVLEKFGPPGFVVDEKMDVVQFRGQTGPYLGPSPGAATLNVLKLVRPELLVALRAALQRAASERLPITSDPVPLLGANSGAGVVIEVMPLSLPESGTNASCFLVLFHEKAASAPSALREIRRRR